VVLDILLVILFNISMLVLCFWIQIFIGETTIVFEFWIQILIALFCLSAQIQNREQQFFFVCDFQNREQRPVALMPTLLCSVRQRLCNKL
jgi:uncharacterized membrane protein